MNFKKRVFAKAAAVALTVSAAATVFAAHVPNAGSAVSNAVVQNTGTATATVNVRYFPQTGGTSAAHQDLGISIAPGAVREFKTADTPLASGFVGAAIIDSTEPLAAIVSLRSTGVVDSKGQTTQAAYNATSTPSSSLRFPSVWGFSGIVSRITVQNTEAEATAITVSFADRAGNSLGTSSMSLPAYGSTTIDLGDADTLPTGFPTTFTDGSITVTSDNGTSLIAGASTAHWPNRAGAYQALTTSNEGTVLYAPSHFHFKLNPSDAEFTLFSALNIQNTSGTAAPITVEYFTRGDLSGNAALSLNCTVPANSAVGINTKNGGSGCGFNSASFAPLGDTWDGSVRVTSTSNINLVGTGITNWGTQGYAGIYALVGTNDAASTIYVPAQYRRMPGGQWAQWSAINLQNIGSSTVNAADLTIRYIDTNGSTVASFNGASLPVTSLPTGAAIGLNTRNGGDLDASAFNSLGDAFIGGIVVEGPAGSQLVAVNNIVYSNRASVYNGVPK